MTALKTQRDAYLEALRILECMTTPGWSIRVWENGGWYWELTNHIVSLHFTSEGEFYALVSDDPKGVGTGAVRFCQGTHRYFKNPNDAVRHAVEYARDVILKDYRLLKETCKRMNLPVPAAT